MLQPLEVQKMLPHYGQNAMRLEQNVLQKETADKDQMYL